MPVAQQQVAAQQLSVGDVLAVGHRDAQHLERAFGARGIPHADVDPRDLVERGVEERRVARDPLVRLDGAVELIQLVLQPSDRQPRQVVDPSLVLVLDRNCGDALEGLDRGLQLPAEQIDDADEIARLAVVGAARADRLERDARLLDALLIELRRRHLAHGGLGFADRDAIQVFGAEVVRRCFDLGGRQLAEAREIVFDPVEVADVDRDLDQSAERPLHVRAVGGLIRALDDLAVAGARTEEVVRLEERLREQEQGVGIGAVLRVVVDDIREDHAGAHIVAQAEEELAVGEPLLDVGRAPQLRAVERRFAELLGVGLDVDELRAHAVQILRPRASRHREQRDHDEQPLGLPGHHFPPWAASTGPTGVSTRST